MIYGPIPWEGLVALAAYRLVKLIQTHFKEVKPGAYVSGFTYFLSLQIQHIQKREK